MKSEKEIENWKKIKDHFDSLPEFKRNNMFYKRAVAILDQKPDPLEKDHASWDTPST